MTVHPDYWRVCSSCKKPLAYQSKYYECSVSTCTRKRTGYVFCSVPCWERHLPGARHRDAGAVEKIAPTKQQWMQECSADEGSQSSASSSLSSSGNQSVSSSAQSPQRYIVGSAPNHSSNPGASSINMNKVSSSMQNEVLVVVSKMKQYVKDIADMNTAGDVATVLSEMIRTACDQAVEQARRDGRKTVMARDFTAK